MIPVVLAVALALQAPAPAPAASPAAAPTGPVVALETSMGTIKIALNKEKAPLSTANFLQYAKSGHYDGTVFHRVIPGFMAQGGGLDAKLTRRETKPPVRNEAKNQLRNLRGTVAMARLSDPDSATDQFFINVKNNASLDFGVSAGYAVFGEVIEGMDVVDAIVNVPTTTKGDYQNVPITPVVIKKVTVVK